MKRKFFTLIGIFTLLICQNALADEGMWMIHALNKAIEKNMRARGLKLSTKEIYNADAPGTTIADAVVSLDFSCTGSIISDEGLVITNHHCAYSDVHSLSTPEHNYLEDGFWAMTQDQEVNIPGKRMLFLKRVFDVTDEVEQLKAEYAQKGQPLGMRKLSYLIEDKYNKQYGYEASLSSMWSGSKYYIALYEAFTDVRLVAAPPVSISAYGGDIDNWEWPQHKCDFAMYRIYTGKDGKPAEYSKENIPLKPAKKLTISTKGYKEGDFTMVIGFPGRTDRYSSAAKARFLTHQTLPITNKVRGKNMEIINKWMNYSPELRLKYSDVFFSLSNVQELQEGEVLCNKRFCVVREKMKLERELMEWIEADPKRMEKWGNLTKKLDKKYADIRDAENEVTIFKETFVRGSKFCLFATRIGAYTKNAKNGKANDASRVDNIKRTIKKDLEGIDLRVEKDLLQNSIITYYNNIKEENLGKFQRELLHECGSPEAVFEKCWAESWMTKEDKLNEFVNGTSTDIMPFADDILIKLLQDKGIADFNQVVAKISGKEDVASLGKEYTHALYAMRLDKGIAQYPDANSTMRLTYGTVGGYTPKDGLMADYKTTTQGIMEKYDPDQYEFSLKDEWKNLLEGNRTIPVNFITDNDITGGNSGSPVMNAKGELIGLAFDGNKESLSGDVYCTKDYNKCVCVDIRYVIWTLKHYAHLGRILNEIGL